MYMHLRPPMKWSSWDCFGTTVTGLQTKQQADFDDVKIVGDTNVVLADSFDAPLQG